MQNPLNKGIAGKRILLTGIRDASLESLIERLSFLNAEVTCIPLISVAYGSSNELSLAVLQSDWVFFTSKNGVHAFFQALPALDSSVKVAVIGSSTAQIVSTYGYTADFVSAEANAIAAAQSFLAYLESTYPYSVTSPGILWPCGNRAYPDLAQELEAGGCSVQVLVLYQTHAAVLSDVQKKQLSTQQWDVVVFGSASALHVYAALSPLESPETIYACLGKKTKQAVIDSGLQGRCIQGQESHYGSLLDVIVSSQAN
jgi:uroporphyrinogen-III synthase